MSMEEKIRARHLLEDKIKNFIYQIEQYRQQANGMRIRDLEIAIARLIDHINTTTHSPKKLDYQFKGQLLKQIYDSRRLNPPSKKGFFSWLADPPCEATYIVNWQFDYPTAITEDSVNEWASCNPLEPSRLLPAPDNA